MRKRMVLLIIILALSMGVVAPGFLLAVEKGGAAEEPGKINVNFTLLLQMVNFIVLIAILYRFLYRPLTNFLAQRQEGIKRSLEEAAATREAAQRALEEYNAKLQASEKHAQAIREAAERAAHEEQQRLMKAAKEEASKFLSVARAEIEQDVKRAKAQLKEEVTLLSLGMAERIIGRNLEARDHQRLIEEYIKEVGNFQ